MRPPRGYVSQTMFYTWHSFEELFLMLSLSFPLHSRHYFYFANEENELACNKITPTECQGRI